MSNERNHTLAWGVRVSRPPEDMTRTEIEDAIHDIAEFASRTIVENRMLKGLIADRLEGKP